MRAFEVALNGKRVCVSGIGDDAVLNVIANHLTGRGHENTHFHVGGLDSERNEYIDWVFMRKLKTGDELAIRVVEVKSVDRPRKRRKRDAAEELRQIKLDVRRRAKAFGWTITSAKKRA